MVDDITGPTAEQIAERAYALYLKRGCQPGLDLEDWLKAEKELTAEWIEQPEATNSNPQSRTLEKALAATNTAA